MKKSRIVVAGITLLIILLIVFMPNYVWRALLYQQPNIDDYKIFDNREVKAGNYQPWEISDEYNTGQLPGEIESEMMSYEPVAFLVIRDRKIIYEQYWDGYDQDAHSNSFSAAKSIVSLLVGAAIDEGAISSLDQKAADFIPEFRNDDRKEISIGDLLTMSSGLDWNESYSSLFSPTTESYYGSDLMKMILERKAIRPPGTLHYYSGMDPEILALVIMNATGMTLSEYASEKFWKPMGAKNDALWSLDHENGLEKAYCCFNSNARDFARWGQLILNNGRWNGKQLISETYLNQATTAATYLEDEDGNTIDYYGFQWWIINYKGCNIPYMRGILGQYVFAIREKNAVVVRLGHKRSEELIGPNRKDIYTYLDAAFALLDN